jgi:hypothetical protein
VPPDPLALLRSRGYLKLLVLAALTGIPVSAVAYGFLALVTELQDVLFDDLPGPLGFDTPPTWWPVPVLMLAGLLVALAITRLPGTGGHSPADGFKTTGALPPKELPGVIFAALATLAFGVVLGPEAPARWAGRGLLQAARQRPAGRSPGTKGGREPDSRARIDQALEGQRRAAGPRAPDACSLTRHQLTPTRQPSAPQPPSTTAAVTTRAQNPDTPRRSAPPAGRAGLTGTALRPSRDLRDRSAGRNHPKLRQNRRRPALNFIGRALQHSRAARAE